MGDPRVAAIAWQLSTVWDLSPHSRKLQQHYYNPASFPPRLQPVHFLQLLYLLPWNISQNTWRWWRVIFMPFLFIYLFIHSFSLSLTKQMLERGTEGIYISLIDFSKTHFKVVKSSFYFWLHNTTNEYFHYWAAA